jgi:tRNA (guanine-N7-)-methyltransferase
MRTRNVKNANIILSNSPYLINNDAIYKGKYNELFGNNNPIDLEIGMGKGDFLIDMAQKHPNINYIGIEKYSSIIVRCVQKLTNIKLNNLKLLNVNADKLANYFDHDINNLYLNFSDPWPKKRTAKRRLTSPAFLNIYENIFKDNKTVILKTDNDILFESSIINLNAANYKIVDIALDLWTTDKIYSETEYEHKFRTKGIKIKYLKAFKK